MNVKKEMQNTEKNLYQLNKNIMDLLNIVLDNETGLAKTSDHGTIYSQSQIPSVNEIKAFKNNGSFERFKETWEHIKNNTGRYQIADQNFYNGLHFFKEDDIYIQNPYFNINYDKCKNSINEFIKLMRKPTNSDLKKIGSEISWFTKRSMDNSKFHPIWITESSTPSSSNSSSSATTPLIPPATPETPRPLSALGRTRDGGRGGSRKKTRGGSNRTLKKKKYSKR